MIYIVNGFPGSGKTTFEDMVCDIVGKDIYGYKISTIDFVKNIAQQCGWDGTKDLKNRKFLSDLKDLLTEWNDVPFKKIEEAVNNIKHDFESYDMDFQKSAIFIDCREPEEIKKLCERLGAISIFIRRDSRAEQASSNHADSDVLNYNYDIIIENNFDLEDLRSEAIKFVLEQKLYLPFNS